MDIDEVAKLKQANPVLKIGELGELWIKAANFFYQFSRVKYGRGLADFIFAESGQNPVGVFFATDDNILVTKPHFFNNSATADRSPLFIYELALTSDERGGGVSKRGTDKLGDAIGRKEIVGGQEFNVLPTGFAHDIIPASDHAVIVFGMNNTETGIRVLFE